MADLDLTTKDNIVADADILASDVKTIGDELETYINARNNATASWDALKVAADITAEDGTAETKVIVNNTATDGDPMLELQLSGTAAGQFYVEDGDSDAIKISDGTNVSFRAVSGQVNLPNQPLAIVSAPTNTDNTTGDGTTHTIEYDTEVADVGSNFNTGTFTFTAPVTGYYIVCAIAVAEGFSAHSDSAFTVVTSNRSYATTNQVTTTERKGYAINVVADMDASDTLYVTYNASGGTKVAEINDSATRNYLSIQLIS